MADFFSFDPSSLVNFIDQVAGDLSSGLYTVISDIWSQINPALGDVEQGVQNTWSWITGFFRAFWNWLQNAVHWILHTLLPAFQAWINKLRQRLQVLLKPIIDWVKWEKAWLDLLYNTYLKPLMNLIQRLRSILVIFRLMHLKFATTLDQYLSDLESRINAAFLAARTDIQQLGNWVNYIIDPTGLFQVYPFLMSALTSAGALWAVVTSAPSTLIGAVDAQANQAARTSGTQAGAQADILARANGPTAADLDRQSQILALYQADGWLT